MEEAKAADMPVTAKMSRGYLWRQGLMAAVCFAVALWFLYDGAVTYPRQRERALKFKELEDADRLDEWFRVAEECGWPKQNPGEPKTEFDIASQYVIGCLLVPPALLFFVLFLRNRRRWIELTETGLRTSWGPQLEFGRIAALNKKKWKKKGIAKIFYEEAGRTRKLVLDDCKYEPKPTVAILRGVESHLDDEQIVGGAPEPPPKEEGEEAEEPGEAERPADPEGA